MDLLYFQLEKNKNIPLYEQLYEGIKNAIIKQQLTEGTKLPSKRQLADFFAISQTTVEQAYAQLLAEGYILSKPRVGYFVEAIDELPLTVQKKSLVAQPEHTTPFKLDFSLSKIDEDSFPFDIWRKYARDLFDYPSKHLLQTGERQGEYSLRTEIAHYLLQSRGIECSPEQIVIGSGTEQLLPMILRLFDYDAKLALENPGYSPIPRSQLQQLAVPIPVDKDGLIIEVLEKSHADLVYVTPSHQFPTGAVLSATRRTQLLKWATQKQSRYIIEDDYDSEFRYIGKPIPALLGLDQNDKVIYMSTFTKSLMPSLRVAYFVLPPALLKKYQQNFTYYSSTVPRFDQQLLANFMRDGHFAKHLNRMRKIYRKKHDKLIDILKNHYPQIQVSGAAAGMHIVISFEHTLTEPQLVDLARQAHIRILPLSNYSLTAEQTMHPTFLIGFGNIPLQSIESAIHTLLTVWHIQ